MNKVSNNRPIPTTYLDEWLPALPALRDFEETTAAGNFWVGELRLVLDSFGAHTSSSSGSGFGFLWRGSTASQKPFLAFGARWTEVWGDFPGRGERDVEGNVARDWPGAGDELMVLFVLEGCMASNMPLLTSSWTVSIAELFPSRSITPIWRRWERAWQARPFRFSNSSPQRIQVHYSEDLGCLLGGDADEDWSEGRLEEGVGGLFEERGSCCSALMGLRASSSMIW